MKIARAVSDLHQLLFSAILAMIAQGVLLFVLSWNVVAVIGCIILDVLLFSAGLADWIYFSREIILDTHGCIFVSGGKTRKFAWNEIYLQYAENACFLFGDAEISSEGIILSAKPISKPEWVGAMTYCRFTHPGISVFIRFSSSHDRLTAATAKLVYKGFVADKREFLDFLNARYERVDKSL